jgi:hypothetical protein
MARDMWLAAAALALLTAVPGCGALRGPPPALQGRIVDADTEVPLAGVLVIVEERAEAWTDRRGRFRVPELEPGRYRVLVIAPGCRTGEGAVAVSGDGGDPVEIRVTLPPTPTLAGEVPPPDESRGRVITAAEIDELGVTRLSEVVRRVAPEMIGAAGDPGRPAALRGRGSPSPSGERVPVLVVDGIVVHAANASALDEIALRDVAWVEILAGALSGWEYGTGGSGGVIRVRTKRGYRVDRHLSPEYCELPGDWEYPVPGI